MIIPTLRQDKIPWYLFSRMLNWPRSLYWAQQRRREKLCESEGVGVKGRTSKENEVSNMMAQVVTLHVMLSNGKLLTSNWATTASFHTLSM